MGDGAICREAWTSFVRMPPHARLRVLRGILHFPCGHSASLRNNEAIFSVTDTGIGIPASHLDHIFDMFWQVEQELTRTLGGTGLGLNVSRRLAWLLGGRLTVTSTPGEGSTFTLSLPLQLDDGTPLP